MNQSLSEKILVRGVIAAFLFNVVVAIITY